MVSGLLFSFLMKTFKGLVLVSLNVLLNLFGTVYSQANDAKLRVEVEKFENGVVANESYFNGATLVEDRSYSNKGEFSNWTRYHYLPENHVIKIDLSIEKESFGQIQRQEEWSGLDAKNSEIFGVSVRHKKWFYSKEAPFKLEFIAHFETQKPFRILRKDYLFADKKTLKSSILFSYQAGSEKPSGFVEKLPRGKVIAHFSKHEKYDQVKTLTEQGKKSEEIRLLKKQREHSKKFLIAVIDSGFDYNHEALVSKWWNNPLEPIDGKDNDGNGWVDDNFGWDQVGNVGLPTESTTSMTNDQRPMSHGTHVAHIAIRGLEDAALVGFGGDYTQADYLMKISAFIKKHPVRLVNLSIGLPKDNKDAFGLRDGIRAMREMIEGNPQVLFVVAAGNENKNLDNYQMRQYPASFNLPNVLKVGALDASTLDGLTSSTAKMADYSNIGKESVDVLAPGKEIFAASLGGGSIAHTGTSMATPYAANLIARLWMEFPAMTAAEIRQLVMETAKPLAVPMLIASKGYIDLKAAQVKARLEFLKNKKSLVEGPNCWNEATYIAGISKGIHHTTGSEFAFIVDSPLCTRISKENAEVGDIVALRRFDRNNKLITVSLFSEVHGYTFLDATTGFTKKGTMASAPYEVMSHEDIFQFYKKSEYRSCKRLGLDRADCNLKPVVYRCQNFEGLLSKTVELSLQEGGLLSQISALEVSLQNVVLDGAALPFDKDKAIDYLKKRLETLEAQGSSSELVEYFALRLESIEMKVF